MRKSTSRAKHVLRVVGTFKHDAAAGEGQMKEQDAFLISKNFTPFHFTLSGRKQCAKTLF